MNNFIYIELIGEHMDMHIAQCQYKTDPVSY